VRRILALCIIALLIFTVNVGCDGSYLSNSLTGAEPTPPKDIHGAPDRAPGLDVSIRQDVFPNQYFQAIQLTTSWMVTYEDGTGIGTESDSPHALQLGADSYNEATFRLNGSSGVVEMRFSDDFPPQSISVQRWNAEYAIGGQDIGDIVNLGERVEISNGTFQVTGDGNDYIYEVYARWRDNGSSWYAFRLDADNNAEIVDLGCCVKEIAVLEKAVLGVNSATHTSNDFVMTINSDKRTYSTSDIIKIWGTLEYVGDKETVEIWHGCPFMLFSIAGASGDALEIGNVLGWSVVDVLASSELERGGVYHFEYIKSGGWSGDDPKAEYWENFFSETDLILPEGEYTITLDGGFGLSERTSDNPSGLRAELKFVVAQ